MSSASPLTFRLDKVGLYEDQDLDQMFSSALCVDPRIPASLRSCCVWTVNPRERVFSVVTARP